MIMKPISVQRWISDVRTRLMVPASSPSGSSVDGGRVLSMIANANEVGFENDRGDVWECEWNSALNCSSEVHGPMGMCVYSSGWEDERWKNVRL